MEAYKMNGIYIAELYKSNPDTPDVFRGERAILGDTGINIGPNGESRVFKNMFERSAYEILDNDKSHVFQINSDLSLSKIGDVNELISLEALLNHISNIVTNDENFFEDDEAYDQDSIEDALSRMITAFDDNDEISRAHLMSLVEDIITLSDFDAHYNYEMGNSEDPDDADTDYFDDNSGGGDLGPDDESDDDYNM